MGKRLILILAAVIMVTLPLFGCRASDPAASSQPASSAASGKTAEESEEQEHTLRLPYDSSDSLNPYAVKTVVNSALIPVIYDGLIRLDETFAPDPVIASSVTGSGTQYTAVLRDGVVFSDGTAVTADDIIYSYEKARTSSRYQSQLANIASVAASGNTVVFQLKEPDPLFANLLDFAIVKKNTGDEAIPVGSGRYMVQTSDSGAKLVYNTKHFRQKTPGQTEIPLTSMPDTEAMLSGIKSGSLSAVYSDLSQGELSTAGALSASVDLGNMVYVGFHSGHEFLNQPAVRQAIAAALDRGTIFYKGFGGRGKQASLPIHPSIGARQGIEQELLLQYDVEEANRLLDGAGYTEKDVSGFRLKDGKQITVTILVNADNSHKKLCGSLIKDMLATVGIQSAVVEKGYEEYLSDVRNENYDLYVGEMKLLPNMSLKPLLEDAAVLGGQRSEALMGAYRAWLDGTGSYRDFMTAFRNEMPFVPLLFRSGILIYNRNISGDVRVSASDAYYNLEEWK